MFVFFLVISVGLFSQDNEPEDSVADNDIEEVITVGTQIKVLQLLVCFQ